MKTYIFATDFSDNARSALAFVLPIIKKLKGQLLLFHSFDYANPFVEAPAYLLVEMNNEKEKKAQEQLIEWQQIVTDSEWDIPCTYIVQGGSFVQNLLNLSEKENPAAIFLGTKGASGLKRLFIGTNAASVIEKSKYPVLTIPQGAAFTGIKSIVFATDYQEKNAPILDQLVKFATIFDAKVEILHVAIEGVKVNLAVYDWYQKTVKEKFPHQAVTFSVVNKGSVQEGIDTYTKLHQPDLVVMTSHEKTWLERMLTVSNSKRQAFFTQTPLWVFHDRVKEKS